MTNDPDETFPQRGYLSPLVTLRDLSEPEWDAACEGAGIVLNGEAREEVGRALWRCASITINSKKEITSRQAKQRLKAFVKGVDQALEAIGYLEGFGIESSTVRPPMGTWSVQLDSKSLLTSLVSSATSPAWGARGYFVKKFLDSAHPVDDSLQAIHALSYSANVAINSWENDIGGRRAAGDRIFVRQLIKIAEKNGIDPSYSQNRSSNIEDGLDHISGKVWDLLIFIWSARPEAFATDKPTLGTYYRAEYARLRKIPPSK